MKENEKNYNERLKKLMFEGHLGITLRVIVNTVVPVVLLGGGGYLLDGAIGSKPWFTVIGVIGAFFLSQYINYKVFNNLTKRK